MDTEQKNRSDEMEELNEIFEYRKAKQSQAPAKPKGTPAKKPDSKAGSAAELKKHRLRTANIMIYSGIALLIIACGILTYFIFLNNSGDSIKSLKFGTTSIELRAGHEQKLKVIAEPSDKEFALNFESKDESVATVSRDGTVTGVGEGTTEVIVSSGSLSSRCLVTVQKDVINSLTVSVTELELEGGETAKIDVSFSPADAKDVSLVWSSNLESVATVDQSGMVKGVESGASLITVTDTVTGKSVGVRVTVSGMELPEAMEFPDKSITVEVGDVVQLLPVFTPDDISNRSAIYYTTDASVVSVTNEGVITAKSAGTVTIEAIYEKDYSLVAQMEVTVIDPFVITGEESDDSKPQPEKPEITVIDGITYINGTLIANKSYSLPADYAPGVNDEAYNALIEMEEAAAAEGLSIFLVSGYRSYDDQYAIYNNYVSMDGQAAADRYSARPGHSEHQTGLAFDLNELEESFEHEPEGIWLAENCHKYGFIIRYPKGKEHITGYMFEPWHVRYLGVELATKVYNSGLTLEEYFGITSVYAD